MWGIRGKMNAIPGWFRTVFRDDLERDSGMKVNTGSGMKASNFRPIPESCSLRPRANGCREKLRSVRPGAEGMPRGYSPLYTRAQSLFRDFAMARADGSLRSLLARLSRIDGLVIDDWAMAPFSEPERRDFWEICEARY